METAVGLRREVRNEFMAILKESKAYEHVSRLLLRPASATFRYMLFPKRTGIGRRMR